MSQLVLRAAAVAFACAWVSPARAQPASNSLAPSQAARPWADGVSEAEQALATELYAAGNQEFTESHFAQALAKYKEALRHWDHPAIRFNIAVCLINLDQPVEAREHLERSLAYGADPFRGDAYRLAMTQRKLLDAQLARVSIVCNEPGAQVALDGKQLFTAPGAVDQYLLPGDHQLVTTKPGFLTASKTLILVAGKRMTYDVPALELKPTTVIARRWDWWKPWAVLGGGVALAAIGVAPYFIAKDSFAAYDDLVRDQCAGGCTAEDLAGSPEIGAKHDRGQLAQAIAFSLFSVGGAVTLTGILGVVLNQPRVQVESRRPVLAVPAVTPVPGGATASMTWRF